MLGLIRAVEPQWPTLTPRLMGAAHARTRPGRRPQLRNGNSRNAGEGTLPPRLASEDRTMPKGGPAALGGADRMDIGRGEPLGTARKGRAQDQILADVRQQNRHQSQLIRNLRRVYGYGFIATGGLAIELAVRVGGLSVPRGALKEICEWARSPPVANSPVPRGSRCRRRE